LAMTNAERQKRWRDERNADAKAFSGMFEHKPEEAARVLVKRNSSDWVRKLIRALEGLLAGEAAAGFVPPDPEIKRLVSELNAANIERKALWKREGQHADGRAAVKKIMQPVWDRETKIETELALPLCKWAKANGLVGSNLFGHLVVKYKDIRRHTGLKANWRVIQWMIFRGDEDALREYARTAPDDEWNKFVDGTCTMTPEGVDQRDARVKARAEAKKSAT
jgi:hypothetical protein